MQTRGILSQNPVIIYFIKCNFILSTRRTMGFIIEQLSRLATGSKSQNILLELLGITDNKSSAG